MATARDTRAAPIHIGQETSARANPGFRALIAADDLNGALDLARRQIEHGAQILAVNVEGEGIDAAPAMARFLRAVAAEPAIARLPVMIDSSDWAVVEAGLKCVQGRAIVRSLSFEQGEDHLLTFAHRIRRYGAAVVVLARDESGEAATVEGKVAICDRAYDLLTQRAGFDPEDIIFDPDAATSALGFIEATWQIREWLPGTGILGDASAVSAGFQVAGAIRSAVEAVFLEHAMAAGLDMAVVGVGVICSYAEVDPELRTLIEDALLQRRPDAARRLPAL